MKKVVILIAVILFILFPSYLIVGCQQPSALPVWTTFINTNDDGLPGDKVVSIFCDNRGNLWFGSNAGVTRYDGVDWYTFTKEDGFVFMGSYDYVMAIAQDNQGNLWFGSNDGLVNRYDGSTWETFRIGERGSGGDGVAPPMLPAVTAIFQDKQGNLWFGTNGGGVSRYDGTNWRTFTTKDGLAASSIEAIFQDRQGTFELYFMLTGLL